MTRTPKIRPRVAAGLLALSLSTAAAREPGPASDFRIGERLRNIIADRETNYRDISWDDLLPKDWNPMAAFKGIDFSRLQDNDPRAMEALEKIKQAWDDAPVTRALEGQRIRLPGFAIPLERQGRLTREFLLLPYFGACIHVPPPPANQMIHVIARKPVPGLNTMDAVWVSGTLTLHRAETGMGIAGYRLTGDTTLPYTRAGKP